MERTDLGFLEERMTTRLFHLGEILSVTTGRRVAPKMDGVYDLLSFLTEEPVIVDQPKALKPLFDKCRDGLLIIMPWLSKIDVSTINKRNFKTWLKRQEEEYGAYHAVWKIRYGG